ncbi:MAG: hypothetical protein KDC38_19525 [Planctomycetes bacterium]|nr:hypothetical protein [Planctomycetota bacterium]
MINPRTVAVALLVATWLTCGSAPALFAQKSDDGMTLEELKKALEKQKAEQQDAEKPASQPAVAETFDRANVEQFVAHLDRRIAQIPSNTRAPGLNVADLHKLVDGLFVDLDDYLRRFPNDPNRARMLHQKARLIAMNQSRFVGSQSAALQKKLGRNLTVEELLALRRTYLEQALSSLAEAETLTDDPAVLVELEKVKGQVFYFGDYDDQAIAQYEKILRDFPDDPDAAETQTALVGAYEKARQFEGGVAACDAFLDRYMKSDFTPHIINYKGKLLIQLGRAADAVAHFEKYRTLMEQAGAGQPVEALGGHRYSAEVRASFVTYLDRLDFQIGFCKYSLGDVVGAKAAFQNNLKLLQAKAEANTIDQVGQVFMSRSTRLLDTLEKLQGKPAPAFDLGENWLNGRLDLEAEKGNLICLFFNPYENRRSEEFAQAIQAFYRDRFADGFRAAWIALPKGRKNWEVQRQKLVADVQKLGVTYPTGLAVTEVWPPEVYAAYNVAPGTPTIVLIDRAGNVAWYKMDPTFRDFEIAGKVAERLLH